MQNHLDTDLIDDEASEECFLTITKIKLSVLAMDV